LGGRGRRICEFEASLVYRLRSRIARAAQRNTVSKQNKLKSKLQTGPRKATKIKTKKKKKKDKNRKRMREMRLEKENGRAE